MMKTKKFFIPIISLLFFFLPAHSPAKDTDLYMASGEGVEPNILIMFDNSGSMDEEVQTRWYVPATTYDPLVVPVTDRDKVYYRRSGGGWSLFADSISAVACAAARTALITYGNYIGDTNATCSSTRRTLRTGNYRNYIASGGDQYERKLDIAKRVISDFLNTINGVRIGMMVFNTSEGGRIHSTIRSLDASARSQLITDVNNINADTWTPLAETLYEAGLYFKGGASYFNSGVSYTSPIQYHCQRNYVIIITDGMSTQDRNSILGTAIGDRDGDQREPIGAPNDPNYESYGSDYLDDVAKYLYDTDLRTDMTGSQNIITYTIGFTITNDLLERAASQGHGRYYYSNSAQELASAFQNIVSEILETTSSFVAPIVPVSRMERTAAGDKIYLAFFQPNQDRMWSGNIKKFGVAQTNSSPLCLNPATRHQAVCVGDLIDINGARALDEFGQILPAAFSYWPSPFSDKRMDGEDVEKGGVGDILLNRSSARNIYTYLGGSSSLNHDSNAFNSTNITPTMLGLLSGDTTGRDKLVQYVHGYDAYDDEEPLLPLAGATTHKRSWILGAFLHSRPFIVHYDSQSVIFAGSNDGMLHAFTDGTGEELWAFIPPNLLTRLQALHADVIESFVDGSPRVYIARNPDGSINRVILIVGQRRGGNRYYGLDVTNPVSPQYLWEINPDAVGSPYAEMGQTWSTPYIGKIAYGAGEKWVTFIAGGYDTNQDNDTPGTDTKGRAVYVVDLLDGSLVKRFSVSDAGYSGMTYSMPSDVARVDTDLDGRIDRLYVGDMGGKMWRFDIGDPNPSNWTGKVVFNAASGLKIFYPPDVTLEKNFEMLFFGTGDREHPKGSTVVNRLYAVKDKNPSTPLTESDLVDVTSDLLQTGTEEQKQETRDQLAAEDGWFILLENLGEKALAPAVVFNRMAFFTTFSPTAEGAGGDPCYVGEGTARVYILQYNTGNAVFNLDLTNDTGGPVISKTDRSDDIGSGIPSGVVITFVNDQAVAYIGVGGGVTNPPVTGKASEQKYWRVVF
jgi:type IV pilus assembly protein PilY1